MNLYPYQEEGVKFIRSRQVSLLYDDPGLGKTAQALTGLSDKSGIIVVCPAAVKDTWKREIGKWTNYNVYVCAGRNSFRWPEANEVVVINYDILPDADVISKPETRYGLILDEIHACKSVKSLRHKKVKSLRSAILSAKGSVVGLTGTPILSRPDDLWGILSSLSLERAAFGNFNNFVRIFNGRRVDYGQRFSKIVWGTPTKEASEAISRVGLGRKRESVLPDLPTKTYEQYFVDIKNNFDELGTNLEEILENPGSLSTVRESICLEKTVAAIDIIKELEESEPLVIFTTHKASAKVLASSLGTVAFDGDSTQEVREKLVDAFMSGKTNTIVGTVFAMGVGLTLTRASHVIFVNRDWTPALNKQAEDRICRIGQKNAVLVTDILASHPTEKLLHKILMRKQGIIDESVEKSRKS